MPYGSKDVPASFLNYEHLLADAADDFRYPAIDEVTTLALELRELRYTPSEDGVSYTMYAADNQKTSQVVLERQPAVARPPR